MDHKGDDRTATERRRVPAWAVVGLLIAIWAAAPPLTPPELNTEFLTEVIDHLIPAALVLVGLGLTLDRRPAPALAGALIVALMGLFMVATHVPLVLQALERSVGWAPTVHHALPGVAVTGLGIWLMRHTWEAAGDEDHHRSG